MTTELAQAAEREAVQTRLDADFQRQVARVADALRAAADRIVREGERAYNANMSPSHNSAAANVIHEFQSMVGNMPFWNMLAAAGDAQTFAQYAQREANK